MNNSSTSETGAAATLQTARDKFAPGLADPTPQTTQEMKLLRSGKAMSRTTLEDGHATPITAKTVETVCFEIDFEATPAELASLRALQAKMEALHAELSKCGANLVVPERLRQQNEVHKAAQEGRDISGMEVQSTEQIRMSFSTRASALRAALVTITHEQVVPAVQPIVKRFAERLEDEMRAAEENYREFCASHDVPVTPSFRWRVLATVASRHAVMRKIHASTWATPKHLVGEIVGGL